MSDELTPCPFCGQEDAVVLSNCVETEACDLFEDCGCEPYSCVVCSVHKGGCGALGGFAESGELAVQKWNARAERTCRIETVPRESDFTSGWHFKCSECGCFIPVDEIEPGNPPVVLLHANYCPNCGAKVVG